MSAVVDDAVCEELLMFSECRVKSNDDNDDVVMAKVKTEVVSMLVSCFDLICHVHHILLLFTLN